MVASLSYLRGCIIGRFRRGCQGTRLGSGRGSTYSRNYYDRSNPTRRARGARPRRPDGVDPRRAYSHRRVHGRLGRRACDGLRRHPGRACGGRGGATAARPRCRAGGRGVGGVAAPHRVRLRVLLAVHRLPMAAHLVCTSARDQAGARGALAAGGAGAVGGRRAADDAEPDDVGVPEPRAVHDRAGGHARLRQQHDAAVPSRGPLRPDAPVDQRRARATAGAVRGDDAALGALRGQHGRLPGAATACGGRHHAGERAEALHGGHAGAGIPGGVAVVLPSEHADG